MFIRSLIVGTVALTAVTPAFAAPASFTDVQPTD